jgi:hypothetical protein
MMQVIGFLSAWLRTHGCLNVVPTFISVRIFDRSATQPTRPRPLKKSPGSSDSGPAKFEDKSTGLRFVDKS